MVPKSQGIKGLKARKKDEKTIPSITPRGVSRGIILSSSRLVAEAISAGVLLKAMALHGLL
jgi:hypothetical protein